MKNILSEPKMISEAKSSGKGGPLYLEVLKMIAVHFVGTALSSIVAVTVIMVHLFTSGKMKEITHQILSGKEPTDVDVMNWFPDWYVLLTLFCCAFMIITILVYCTKIEKRPLRTLGVRSARTAIPEYLAGLGLGILFFSVAVGICALTGSVNVSFAVTAPPVWLLLLYLVAFMIQGMSEELLCRGYFMVSASRKSSMIAAVITSSLIFAFLHLSNNAISLLAVLNLFLFGVFAAIYVIKRGNIWGIAAFHTAWNFAQGNLFGISVSGTEVLPSPITTLLSGSKTVINGGDFGLEGGVAVTIVLTIGILILTLIPQNRAERSEQIAESSDSVASDK